MVLNVVTNHPSFVFQSGERQRWITPDKTREQKGSHLIVGHRCQFRSSIGRIVKLGQIGQVQFVLKHDGFQSLKMLRAGVLVEMRTGRLGRYRSAHEIYFRRALARQNSSFWRMKIYLNRLPVHIDLRASQRAGFWRIPECRIRADGQRDVSEQPAENAQP